MDTNQEPPRPRLTLVTSAPSPPEATGSNDEALALSAERLRTTDAVGGAMRVGLLRWTIVLAAASFGTLALGHIEGAVLMAMAGMFALAQSWDVRDRALTGDPIADVSVQPGGVGTALRMLVPMVAPLAGAVLYTGLAVYARTLQVTAASIGV
ncbi:MAG: hypothetical protein K8R56_08225, partial [Candidatus Eisenbacteria bacterium]|nr:hypothetical protein [Candidatus Eisenbacteria bacterium]